MSANVNLFEFVVFFHMFSHLIIEGVFPFFFSLPLFKNVDGVLVF